MQTRTQSTVVAVFRDAESAQAALNDLKSSGLNSSDVYISNDTSASGADAVRTGETTAHHEGGITGWFKSIFGQEEHEDRPYFEDATSRGNVLLSATVPDEGVDRVADILERHSPVDVHREAGSDTAGSDTGRYDAKSDRGTTGTTGTAARETLTGAGGVGGRDALTGTGKTAARDVAAAGTRAQTGNEQSIPVVREDLQVGKRTVLRGGVRVYSRMVDEPVEEQVRLRDEHVHVERTPVNREANAADLRPGQERTFEVKEYAEEAVVGKTARVVEEIRVGKDTSERTETVRDSVRHTEVKIDNLGAGERSGTAATNAAAYAGSDAAAARTGMAGGTSSFGDDYRRDFQQNYSTSGGRYEDYAPSYEYGNTMAADPRYKGRSWDEVEPSLRQEYGSKYPNSTWENMKNSVRYGWDRVKAKV